MMNQYEAPEITEVASLHEITLTRRKYPNRKADGIEYDDGTKIIILTS